MCVHVCPCACACVSVCLGECVFAYVRWRLLGGSRSAFRSPVSPSPPLRCRSLLIPLLCWELLALLAPGPCSLFSFAPSISCIPMGLQMPSTALGCGLVSSDGTQILRHTYTGRTAPLWAPPDPSSSRPSLSHWLYLFLNFSWSGMGCNLTVL